jgi:hypothetical protein
MERVAPGTAIIASSGADEYRGPADQRALALYRRPEDFADRDRLRHGRYSAQLSGVSLTPTATTSGQRALHHS